MLTRDDIAAAVRERHLSELRAAQMQRPPEPPDESAEVSARLQASMLTELTRQTRHLRRMEIRLAVLAFPVLLGFGTWALWLVAWWLQTHR